MANNNSILYSLIISLPSITFIFEILVIIIALYLKKINILLITTLFLFSRIFYLFLNIYEVNIFISIFMPFIFAMLITLKKEFDDIKQILPILFLFGLYIILGFIFINNTNFIMALNQELLEQNTAINDLFLFIFFIFFIYLIAIRYFVFFENIVFVAYFLSVIEFIFYSFFEKNYTTYFELASFAFLVSICIELYKLIFYDFLTKIKNSKAYDITRVLSKDVICIISIDYFDNLSNKNIEFSNYILIKIAGILSDNFKNVYKIDGDKFLILFKKADFKNCLIQLEELRKAISKTNFDFNGNILQITISAGVSQVVTNKDIAFKTANEMLCIAKNNGSNRVVHEK